MNMNLWNPERFRCQLEWDFTAFQITVFSIKSHIGRPLLSMRHRHIEALFQKSHIRAWDVLPFDPCTVALIITFIILTSTVELCTCPYMGIPIISPVRYGLNIDYIRGTRYMGIKGLYVSVVPLTSQWCQTGKPIDRKKMMCHFTLRSQPTSAKYHLRAGL